MTASEIHYNTSLPPVGNWLWLKLNDDTRIKAKRTSYIQNKTDSWPVVLECGTEREVIVKGWAYP